MAKRRSYLLLSLASGALSSAAVVSGCAGSEVSEGPAPTNAGGGGSDTCGVTACGLVANPSAGHGGAFFPGSVVQPPNAGAGGTEPLGYGGAEGHPCGPSNGGANQVICGSVIGPGAAGEAGGGPCGGGVCGVIIDPGAGGEGA